MRRTLLTLLVPLVAQLTVAPATHAADVDQQGRAVASLRRDAHAPGEFAQGRPTDGAQDPYGDGYRVPSRTRCATHVCLHWVATTSDRPPSQSWVTTTLNQMNKVWAFEVGHLGYRAPLPDGDRGGNAKFDVYLADVGSKGYYGYCAPERPDRHNHDLAPGFCVLDNDFSEAQFGAPPMVSLKVTAAHEFFHAVQYAYDVHEDRWLMEATATWMEERYADNANDNRQYLSHGQLGEPSTPLDKYGSGAWQYGNWLFFESLSDRFGDGVVRSVWGQSAAFAGAPNRYSLGALRTVLSGRGTTLPRAYAAFAAANQIPAESYPEGAAYQPTRIDRTIALSEVTPSTGVQTTGLQHLTSSTIALTPDPALTAPTTQIRLDLDLPPTTRGSAAYVIVRYADGTVASSIVNLDGNGDASVVRPFSAASVSAVTITLANGSSRSTCDQHTGWACHGTPLDYGLPYTWQAALTS